MQVVDKKRNMDSTAYIQWEEEKGKRDFSPFQREIRGEWHGEVVIKTIHYTHHLFLAIREGFGV